MLDQHFPRDPYAALGRRVLDALDALAPGEGRLPAETDYAALTHLFPESAPARILDVGGGSGGAALLLALAWPHARIVAIDPDERLEADASAGQPNAISWTALALAQAAAARLGVDDRIRFVAGAFATSARTRHARLAAVGPEICGSEPDFDLIVLDGSPDADARAADLRLAASALAPSGVIAAARVIGPDAALVRAGIFEFLRYNPDFHFVYPRLSSGRGAFGFLRRRSADWFPGFAAPHAARAGDISAETRRGLGEQVNLMLGKRPVLETAVGDPALGAGRVLRLTAADLSARFVDPVIDRILAALDHAPGSALFSADLLDFASDELVQRLFAHLADIGAPAVFAITPPGEEAVAGPASRPAARVIDLAVGQGLGVHGPAGLEFEAARHAGGGEAAAGSSSRYLSLLLFAAKAGWRDAAGRSLIEVSPVAAARHEQVELQRIQTHAALQARIADHAHARAEAESLGADLGERLDAAQRAADVARQLHERTRAAHETAMAQLRSELREQTELGATLHAALEEADAVVMRERERLQKAEADFADRLNAAESAMFDHRDRFQRDLSDLGERLDEALHRASAADAALAATRAELDSRDAAIADSRIRIGALTSERANLEGQLHALTDSMEQTRGRIEALTSEANRMRADVQTLRDSEASLRSERDGLSRQLVHARNRLDELSALRAVKASENDRLIQDLDDARSSIATLQTEHDGLARNHDAALMALNDRLTSANSQVVANALREMDARLRLDGVDAHLVLSQQAIDLFRADPAAFRAAALTYPRPPEHVTTEPASDDDLVGAAKVLHGRAADMSRDLANVLESIGGRVPSVDGTMEARLKANDLSHREALDALRTEFADRLADADRAAADKARLESEAGAADATIARIESALAAGNPSAGTAGLGTSPNRQHRLEHILHVLEANAAKPARAATPAETPQPAAQPVTHQQPRSAETPASPSLASPTSADGWVDRGISAWVAPPEPPAPRTLAQRADNWVKTYPETYRLTRLQRYLRARFEPAGLKPRVFDAAYYLSQGPIEPHTNALRHYLLIGENEGRRPIPAFDPTYYRRHFRNPPSGAGSLLGHFLMYGAEQGLSPSAELSSLPVDARAAGVSPLELFFRWTPPAP